MAVSSDGVGARVVRRQLGRKLQRLREDVKKTYEDIAATQIASPSKMWRIETGKVAVKPGDVWALCNLYGTGKEVTEHLAQLAAGTREEGWWEEYSGVVPEWVGLHTGLEGIASALHDYNSELIHGLLQTEDYARAVTRANPRLTAELVEQRVAFRMQRQRTWFQQHRILLDVVLTAGAFSLAVGSPAVMKAQIAHLLAITTREDVSVRVLKSSNGVHMAMRGPFTIMDFLDEDDPALVYVETLVGSRFMERPEHLAEFRHAFGLVRAQAVPLKEYLQ